MAAAATQRSMIQGGETSREVLYLLSTSNTVVVVGEACGSSAAIAETWLDRSGLQYTTGVGKLLSLIKQSPLLQDVDVVLLDARDRTLLQDILLGLIRKIQRKRPELKVVILSSLEDAPKVRDFFSQKKKKKGKRRRGDDDVVNLPAEQQNEDETSSMGRPTILDVSRRASSLRHDVDIFYLSSPCSSYVEETVSTILSIDRVERQGDVLVFLPREEDVQECSESLGSKCSHRRVVFSTSSSNVAANDGDGRAYSNIVYVVDCCFEREKHYNPMTGLTSVVTTEISKATAVQRALRAGNQGEAPGKCFRLCTKDSYDSLPQSSIPEMQRSELSQVVLQLKALGVENIMSFDWIAPPPAEAMIRALELLHALGALDADAKLTSPLGIQMAELPLHPMIGKALLASSEMKCVEEMLTIASVMTVDAPVWQQGRGRRLLERQKLKFSVAEGDHVTYLNIIKGFLESDRSSSWCQRRCLNYSALVRALEIKRELFGKLQALGVSHSSCGRDMLPVRRALAHGLFANAAVLISATTDEKGRARYATVRGKVGMRIHDSSILHRNQPACVLYSSAVQTGPDTHEMFEVMSLEEDWLLSIAPHFYAKPDREKS